MYGYCAVNGVRVLWVHVWRGYGGVRTTGRSTGRDEDSARTNANLLFTKDFESPKTTTVRVSCNHMWRVTSDEWRVTSAIQWGSGTLNHVTVDCTQFYYQSGLICGRGPGLLWWGGLVTWLQPLNVQETKYCSTMLLFLTTYCSTRVLFNHSTWYSCIVLWLTFCTDPSTVEINRHDVKHDVTNLKFSRSHYGHTGLQ